ESGLFRQFEGLVSGVLANRKAEPFGNAIVANRLRGHPPDKRAHILQNCHRSLPAAPKVRPPPAAGNPGKLHYGGSTTTLRIAVTVHAAAAVCVCDADQGVRRKTSRCVCRCAGLPG